MRFPRSEKVQDARSYPWGCIAFFRECRTICVKYLLLTRKENRIEVQKLIDELLKDYRKPDDLIRGSGC